MKLADVRSNADLKAYLLISIPGLEDAYGKAQMIETAMLLRDWVSARSNYSGPDLLMDYKQARTNVAAFIHRLASYEGGLWCAGVSEFYAAVLQLFDIPAGNFCYGYTGKLAHLCHTTTVFAHGHEGEDWFVFYNADAYLNYHWTDAETGEMLPFVEVLGRALAGQHDQVKRVDAKIERVLITPPGQDPAVRQFLFDGDMPGSETLPDGKKITRGGTHDSAKLFLPHSPQWVLAQEVIDGRSMDVFLIDMMLQNPRFRGFSMSQIECRTSLHTLEQALNVFAQERRDER